MVVILLAFLFLSISLYSLLLGVNLNCIPQHGQNNSHDTGKPDTFYNISYHQSNYLQHQTIISCSEFFHICFCKPMGNITTKYDVIKYIGTQSWEGVCMY